MGLGNVVERLRVLGGGGGLLGKAGPAPGAADPAARLAGKRRGGKEAEEGARATATGEGAPRLARKRSSRVVPDPNPVKAPRMTASLWGVLSPDR